MGAYDRYEALGVAGMFREVLEEILPAS